jgi:multiple RNA-binding domain-containing protein 1
MAKKLRVKKREILDHTGDNLAVKLALAETHIINETKAYFESVCISLNK